MVTIGEYLAVKRGQVYKDSDLRNNGKTKGGKPSVRAPRLVEIVSLPTLSSPGAFRVVKAPAAPHTEGKLRPFSLEKLAENYDLVKDV